MQLTDLREILHYVPRFRDRIFVIAIDGAVVANDNFPNLLLDIALLRSLRIGVALVHGASAQIRQLAAREGVKLSNSDGTGVTDSRTLEFAITAANRVTHEILVGLAANDLRASSGNALICHPAGILGGVDYQFTGRVEKVDIIMLRAMLDHDIIPVIAPIGSDGETHTYRLNSDAVAVEVAKALQAVKLIYLCAHEPPKRAKKLLRHLNLDDAAGILKKNKTEVTPLEAISKMENAIKAVKGGVPRVHIVDGRVQAGLLAEVFSNEGIGTLIHANEYQAIRRAQKRDLRAIYQLLQRGMDAEEILKRTRADVEKQIQDYFVFEVDRNAVACGALHFYSDANKAEIASIYVDDRYANQGIGAMLIQYAEKLARDSGVAELFCLSTQAVNFFVHKGGFSMGTPDDLPPARREIYDRSARNSRVLIKKLTAEPTPLPPTNRV
jgi:amino-acid N-acetyltransferase